MLNRHALTEPMPRLKRAAIAALDAAGKLWTAPNTLAGLLLTWWMSDVLRQFIPDATLPISLAADVSGRVLLLAVALSTFTALLAGLAPALWAARPNLVHVLRASGRTAAMTPRAETFRRALVVAQVAIALVTLACAALVLKSLHAAKRAHPGFDARGVLPPDRKGGGGCNRERLHERHNTRLTQTTGRRLHAAADPYKFQLF